MFLHGKGRLMLWLNIQMIEDLYFEIWPADNICIQMMKTHIIS